jgi:hypothetical protein
VKLSHRSTVWLLVAGAVYALLVRGWVGVAVPGLLPGAGYNPLIAGDGALASMSGIVEYGLDATLLGIAICWVVTGLDRRSLLAMRALGIAYLIDCGVYIGSVAFVPAATAAGGISRFAIVALLQTPLIAIATRFVTIGGPRTGADPRIDRRRLDRVA